MPTPGRAVSRCLLLTITISGAAFAQPVEPLPSGTLPNDVASLMRLVRDDTKTIATAPIRWDARTWKKAALAAGAVGALMLADDAIHERVMRSDNRSLERFVDFAEPFGSDYSWLVLAAFYGAGRGFRDVRATSVAEDGLVSCLIAAGIVTPALKYAAGRARPTGLDDSDQFRTGGASFPSGHVTQAFALASVIAAHYDNVWIDTLAYGIAGAVGVARIEHGAHYSSDVLAAAIIGTAVGRSVVRMNRGRRFALVPLFSGDGASLAVRVQFEAPR